MLYNNIESSFNWSVGASTGTPNVKIWASGLAVNGTTVSSDKILTLNEKPLVNAIGVINRFEPVEYDQTVSLIEQYTDGSPQFDQCGSIVQKEEKLKRKNG